MNWTELDWESLDRHREQFLGARPSDGPYWASAEDLESYDLTFGERIGWKWDAVLAELRLQGWRPPGGVVLDWGCGSGIAGRRVVAAYGTAAFSSLLLWRSTLPRRPPAGRSPASRLPPRPLPFSPPKSRSGSSSSAMC
jgi:hypothetical protein